MYRKCIVFCILILFWGVLAFGNVEIVLGSELSFEGLSDDSALYLPIVSMPDQFVNRTQPIWSHLEPLSNHEVNLFRNEFDIISPAFDSKIYIFADTRYELWIDGERIGRGPARFSMLYHEYDVHSLGDLKAGTHTVAVLVQWAPNIRRSESLTPYLQAYVTGSVNGEGQILTCTDYHWKVLNSDAWLTNSAPVHSWQLIGPTELMDLRLYPTDWIQKEYNDVSWANAVIKDPNQTEELVHVSYHSLSLENGILQPSFVLKAQDSPEPALYQPRTISFLVEKEFPYTILDVGLLSPDSLMLESVTQPDSDDPFSLDFFAETDTVLTLERLSGEVETPLALIYLDEQVLEWSKSSEMRPDVEETLVNVTPGGHQLTIEQSSEDGVRLSLSTENINWGEISFSQGINAGKRLLLAEYSSQESIIELAKSDTIIINQLPAYLVLDVGRVIHGRLSLDILGQDGTVVDIGWDERLFEDNLRPLPYPGSAHSHWNQTDSWLLDGRKHQISTIDTRTGRYILLAFWGDTPVTLENIHVMEERYPVNLTGDFESSDELLDQIWQLGVDTAFPNMTDAYADPWRERGQWWGDAYIVDRINRVAFGDISLLRRGLKLMADGFMDGKPVAMAPNGNITGVHMLDYAMLWVHDLQEYAVLSEDWEFLLELYPTVKNFMRYLDTNVNPTTGLLDLPKAHWSQTAYIDTRAYHNRYGQSTAVNSVYYGTLLKAVWIADALGDNESARAWQLRAAHLKDQVDHYLYNPNSKRYFASLYNGEYVSPTPQAQAWALTYGLVAENEEVGVADALLELLSDDPADPNVGIYGMYWIFEGLERAGRVQDVASIIRLYYGYIVNKNATTLWERFDSDQYYWASQSHGWGGSPTWFLSTHVLGAKWTGPSKWQVKPSFSVVDYVSGAIPLPDGLVFVDWDNNTCQNKILDVQSPEVTSGEVIIPIFQNTTVLWDGQIIWTDGKPNHDDVELVGSDLYVTVPGGNHHFEINGECVVS